MLARKRRSALYEFSMSEETPGNAIRVPWRPALLEHLRGN